MLTLRDNNLILLCIWSLRIVGDKGTGIMRVRLGDETLFQCGTLVPGVLFKVVSVAIVRCREDDEQMG